MPKKTKYRKMMKGRMKGHETRGTKLELGGILDNAVFIDYLLEPFIGKLKERVHFDYQAFKEQQYDKLAGHVRAHVNLPLVYQILKQHD